MERPPWRVAVVGGGISGLAAAYTLARARQGDAPVEEFLIESSDRLGGLIRTERTAGFVIEAGPDSFLAEKPEAAALCRELGLGKSLIGSNDAARRTSILHRGRLIPLPDGLMLMVPTRLWPILATPLVGWAGKLAIVTEPLRGIRRHGEEGAAADASNDESVASFVRRHFGRDMAENVTDPLLAGVFGGDSGRLSARSALPRFWEMERREGSLTRAVLRAHRGRAKNGKASSAQKSSPLFMTLKEGLTALVETLSARLDGARLCLRRRVDGLEKRDNPGEARFIVRCESGAAHEADAVILALPAHECARLLGPVDRKLAETLAAIPYTSAVTVSLAYGPAARATLPAGFGFLVPHHEGKRMLACTFVHAKFDHRALDGHALLRCFLGGARDPDVLELSDGEIVSTARRELRAILGLDAEPLFYRIARSLAAMPQYEVGHAARLEAIEQGLKGCPSLFLAGNAYSGIGISDCIRTGRAAAQQALRLAGRKSSGDP